MLLFVDSQAGDQAEIVAGSYAVAGGAIPLAGGTAGGPARARFAGGRALLDGVVAVAIGSSTPIGVGIAHGCVTSRRGRERSERSPSCLRRLLWQRRRTRRSSAGPRCCRASPFHTTRPARTTASPAAVQCVDKTVRQMTRRFDALASSCDHGAIFSLTYLRVTEEYRRTIAGPFFEDTPFVNYEDTLFGHYYFGAYDAWAAGRSEQVPPAWRVAFDAARTRAVSASGDLLLGINAHVQRDLPLVLYSVGLVRADGTSRKADHDRVDIILNRVADDVVAEIARRFDPSADDSNLPTTLDDAAIFQSLAAWREKAWRNAELLAAAPTTEARALVVAGIERDAAAEAKSIVAATRYPPLLGGSAARDAFCALHHDDP